MGADAGRKGRAGDKANGVTLVSIVAEVERQLEWRGPSGKSQGHIVLDRPQAELLLQMAYEMMKKPMVTKV